MTALALESFGTVSLAGGGNRCWWQAGVLDVWLNSGRLQARRLLGTSAGAGVAAATLCGALSLAIDHCRRAYAENPSMWRGRRGAWFAQEEIYPTWVRSYLSEDGFERLRRSGVELWVGVGRLPRALPAWAGVALGIAAYVVDKHGGSQVHPRLAHWCGLRMDLHSLHDLPNAAAAAHLLVSAAAAPPFIARRTLHGRTAVDGGFADNAPRMPAGALDRPHLMLLTRHYPKRPTLFEFEGRTYLQPTRPVPVSTWDCTRRTDIMSAVDLGRRDGLQALRCPD